MVQINFGQREVSCKVVFYGPGMSGKTTNLEIIHKKAPKEAVGEMVSIATETDRTLYFDFLPLDLGQVAGMRTRFQLYTVPGQIYYNATRKLVLQGVDGVIFVADSNPDKMNENLESLQNLRDNLAEMNLTIDDVPLVLQYNKRDLPNAMSMADMNAKMNPMGAPAYEGVAREGKGVFATLKEISRLVIERLNKEHAPAANRRRTNTSLTAPPAANPAPPPAPTPARPAPSLPPQPVMAQPSNTPLSTPRQPQPRPAPSGMPPAPVRQMGGPPAHTPTRGNAVIPPTPMHAAAQAADPREKHLAKAKPPAIEQLRNQPTGQKVNLGATDPSLKRYQETQKSGSGVMTLLIVLIFLVIFVIAAVAAVIYVPAVRALLPQDIQQKLIGSPAATPAAPATTPAPATPDPVPAATTTPPAPAAPALAQPSATTPAAPTSVPALAPTPVPVPAQPEAAVPPAPVVPAPAAPVTAPPLPPEQTPAQPPTAPTPATPATPAATAPAHAVPAPAGSTNGQ